jgi:hypothetical protein
MFSALKWAGDPHSEKYDANNPGLGFNLSIAPSEDLNPSNLTFSPFRVANSSDTCFGSGVNGDPDSTASAGGGD